MLKMTSNFAVFAPSPVKIRGGWARSLYHLLSFTYDQTYGIHLAVIHCAVVERRVLIFGRPK